MSKTKRIIIIVVLAIALAAFLFSLFYTPAPEEETNREEETTNTKPRPVITKEGELYFIDDEIKDTLKKIIIEVADNDYERQQGLMYRHNIPDSTGMLFVFPDEDFRSFWMKNTPTSLDIMYVNENMEIVSIHKYTVPYSEAPIPSGKPAKYVVEVPNGFADNYDIQEGDKISFTLDE